jgi:hypothetical protein
VVAFAMGECSALSRLVQGYSVNLMNFTFWTVSLYFFRNVHGIDQLRNKETNPFLYFMTFTAETNSFFHSDYDFFFSSCCRKPPIHNNNQQTANSVAYSVSGLL